MEFPATTRQLDHSPGTAQTSMGWARSEWRQQSVQLWKQIRNYRLFLGSFSGGKTALYVGCRPAAAVVLIPLPPSLISVILFVELFVPHDAFCSSARGSGSRRLCRPRRGGPLQTRHQGQHRDGKRDNYSRAHDDSRTADCEERYQERQL